MTEAQFWGLLVSIIALGLGVLRMIHHQNKRIDEISKEQEESNRMIYHRIDELNRNQHHSASALQEEMNNKDKKAHAQITQNQLEAEKRFATKDGTERALDRISNEIKSMGKDLKSEIVKLRDRQDQGEGR